MGKDAYINAIGIKRRRVRLELAWKWIRTARPDVVEEIEKVALAAYPYTSWKQKKGLNMPQGLANITK